MNKLLYILLFLLSCSALYAQQTASVNDSVVTEEILVTANRVKTTPLLSPNKIEIIGQKYFSSINGDKLSDVLNHTDGTFVRDYGFNSGLKLAVLNSTQAEHTLILYNGIKLNSCQNSEFDAGLLQLDDISRIEISKGGASSLYGTEAIGGVINIITGGTKLDKPFGFELKNELGSYGYNRFYARGSNMFGNGNKSFAELNYSFSNENARNNYEYNYYDGFSETKKVREYSDYSQKSLNLDLLYRINHSTGLRYFTFYNYKNRGLPGVDAGYTSTASRQIDRDLISSVELEKKLSAFTTLISGISYKYSLMNYYDVITSAQPINSFYKINNFGSNSEIKFTPSAKSEFDYGFDISYNTMTSNETEASKLFQGALYAAGKIETSILPVSKFTIYPSLRSDYYSYIDKNVFSGKFGINIKPFENSDFSLKSSFANSFKVPTFNELYWLGLGNKNLLPEKSLSFDAGAYYSFNLLIENKIEVSYFNINTTDRIVWTPDSRGVWRPLNVGKVNSEGIDASIKAGIMIFKYFHAAGGLNYNYATALKKSSDFENDPTYNKQLLYLPQEYVKSSVNLDFMPLKGIVKQVSLNFFYNFTGKRFIDPENTRFIPYYELIDANLNLTLNLFKTETSLKFAVNNFANEDYQVMYGYPMPLRNYKLQIGIKY